MKSDSKKAVLLFARYLFIFLLGIGNLFIFYKVLTPTTVFAVSKILSIFNEVYVLENLIVLDEVMIELIPACVAGSAFFLMFLLVFSTANVKPLKRFYLLLSTTIILFALNVARIIFLVAIAGKNYFEIVHWTLWNLVSVFFVVAIWFFVAWLYKINSVPIYSDILFLKELTNKKEMKRDSKKRKNSKRSSKH